MARTKQVRNQHDAKDKKAVIEVARKSPRFHLAKQADPSLWSDRDVILAAVASNGLNLKHASSDLKMDPEIVSIAVTSNGIALSCAPDKFKSDPAIVTAAVKSCGVALFYVQGALRHDPKIVWLAIENTGMSLEFVSNDFKDDKELVLTALRVGTNKQSARGEYTVLNFASQRLRGDRDVVRAAIRHCGGMSLMYASMELRGDRELVMAAIDSHAGALEYASPALRADRDVVLRAVAQSGTVLAHVSGEFRGDREMAMAAVNAPNGNGLGGALGVLSEALRGDRNFVLYALSKSGYDLRFASTELRGDREVVETALQNRKVIRASAILEHASEELRGDRQLIRQGIQEDSLTLHFASKSLQLDPDMVALHGKLSTKMTTLICFFILNKITGQEASYAVSI